MERVRLCVAVAAALAATIPVTDGTPPAGASPADGPAVTMTELLDPGGEPLIAAERINERGQVAAMADDDGPAVGVVVWERGRTTRVTPEGLTALPTDISDRGQVTGVVLEGPAGPGSPFSTVWPFSWSHGELTRLTPEGVQGATSDVDERGRVLGYRQVGTETEAVVWDRGRTIVGPAGAWFVPWDDDRPQLNARGRATLRLPAAGGNHAGVWHVGGDVTDLGTFGGPSSRAAAINDRGWVVGDSDTAQDGPHAFLWRRGRVLDLGRPGEMSFAVDVNDRGQVLLLRGGRSVLWQDGRETDLGDLGGDHTTAVALNERGQVAGRSETADGTVHAFLWDSGRMIDLGARAGDVPSAATDLNERGQVIGRLDTTRASSVPVLWTVAPT